MSMRTPQQPCRRGESTLNFRVDEAFRFEFREFALHLGLKHAQLLRAAMEAWKEKHGCASPVRSRRPQAPTEAAVAVVNQGVG